MADWRNHRRQLGHRLHPMTAPSRRLVLLISGRGSNLKAFIEAQGAGRLAGQIVGVISNRPAAPGLHFAKEAGIATTVVDHTQFPNRETFDQELAGAITAFRADVVVLAGFMRILTPAFVATFYGQLVNIHPSLLPKYPGLNTHQRAIEAGDPEAGATVHFVTADLDGGPGILHTRVAIQPEDNADTLAARILPLEHQLYPEAVNRILTGQVELKEGQAWQGTEPLPEGGALWTPH